jgi:DNA invertase Pin-like site-specific DNA recombinase
MANFAYLRVSTDQQDVNNQRYGILEYANKLSLPF